MKFYFQWPRAYRFRTFVTDMLCRSREMYLRFRRQNVQNRKCCEWQFLPFYRVKVLTDKKNYCNSL